MSIPPKVAPTLILRSRQSNNHGSQSFSTRDQLRNNPQAIPELDRPQVILRLNDEKHLLLSGLLDKGASIAEHAIVVDAHLGSGNVLLFANNPVYRGETIGSYNLVFNAILNFNQLSRQLDHAPAGKPDANKPATEE